MITPLFLRRGLLPACVFLLLGPTSITSRPPPADLRQVLVDGLRSTHASLHWGRLAWSRTTTDVGFIAPDCNFQTLGHHDVVFDGDRVAVLTTEKPLIQDATGLRLQPPSRLAERWDGALFYAAPLDGPNLKELALLTRPKFHLYHNLFEFVFRSGPGAARGVCEQLLVPDPPEGVTRELSLVERDGEPAIEVVYRRGDEGSTRTWYAVERGFHKVADEWYDGRVLTFRYDANIELVDGIWFPTRITMTSFAPDGHVMLKNEFLVHREDTCFNKGVRPAADEFRLSATPGTELSDYRLGLRLNYIVGRNATDPAQLKAFFNKVKDLTGRKMKDLTDTWRTP